MYRVRGLVAAAAVLLGATACGSEFEASRPPASPTPTPTSATVEPVSSRAEVAPALPRPVVVDCRGHYGTSMVADGTQAGSRTPRTAEARLRLYLRGAERSDPKAERAQFENYVRLETTDKNSAVFAGLRDDGSVFAAVGLRRGTRGGWSVSGARGCSDTVAPDAGAGPVAH